MITKSVKTREHSGETIFTIEGEDHAPMKVEVFHPHKAYGEMTPATVSYPSRGDMTLELVEEFTTALRMAVVEARRLNTTAASERILAVA